MSGKKILNLLFFGPQGSGKGTQAKLLAEKFNLRHLSSGDALRTIAKSKTSLGRYLKHQLATGKLTPIPKLLEVFDMVIKKVPLKQGIVFDGFARQITETRLFLRRLKKLNRQIDAALMIEVSEKETVKRLSKRLQCSKCNNLFIAGPKLKAGSKCPKCGGILITRSDDKPPAIKRRLKIYRKRTLPVIRFFNQQGLLIKINGEQSVAAVHKDILQALRRRNLIG